MNRRTIQILSAAFVLAIGLWFLDRRDPAKRPPGDARSTPASAAEGSGAWSAEGRGGPPAAAGEAEEGGSSRPGVAPRGTEPSVPGAESASPATPAAARAPAEELNGQVQDLEGAPIAGATLRLAGGEGLSGGPRDRLARSDATGRFQFRGLQPGIWRLSASRAGRLAVSALEVTAPSEGPVVVVMAIDRPPTVKVIDERGGPLSGAAISTRALDRDGLQAAGVPTVSGPGGEALLEGLPEEDLVQVEVRAESRGRPPAAVTRTAGELRASVLVIEMEAGGRLGGKVVDAGGAPVANVKLVLIPAPSAARKSPPSRWSLHTVSSGEFLFSVLPRGEYDLYADGGESGRRKIPGLVVGPDGGAEDLEVQLAPTGSPEANEAVPPPPAVAVRAHQAGPIPGTGSIRGRLSSGGPAPDFSVGILPPGSTDGPTWIFRQTARRPEFKCTGLPPGTYDVVLIVDEQIRSRVAGVEVVRGSVAGPVELRLE